MDFWTSELFLELKDGLTIFIPTLSVINKENY